MPTKHTNSTKATAAVGEIQARYSVQLSRIAIFATTVGSACTALDSSATSSVKQVMIRAAPISSSARSGVEAIFLHSDEHKFSIISCRLCPSASVDARLVDTFTTIIATNAAGSAHAGQCREDPYSALFKIATRLALEAPLIRPKNIMASVIFVLVRKRNQTSFIGARYEVVSPFKCVFSRSAKIPTNGSFNIQPESLFSLL